MAKPPKKPKPEDIETDPNGWDRFMKVVKQMAPPKPRMAVKRSKPKRGGKSQKPRDTA